MVALREFELQYLQRAVDLADGKRVRAAEWLGISRKTLWEKLRKTNGEVADVVRGGQWRSENAEQRGNQSMQRGHGVHLG